MPAVTRVITSRSRGVSESKRLRKSCALSSRCRRSRSRSSAIRTASRKFLLTYRLGKEFNRASFHSLDRHRNVTVARDKNDWNIDLNLGLKIDPAQFR